MRTILFLLLTSAAVSSAQTSGWKKILNPLPTTSVERIEIGSDMILDALDGYQYKLYRCDPLTKEITDALLPDAVGFVTYTQIIRDINGADYLLIVDYDDMNASGLYRSTDRGKNWTQVIKGIVYIRIKQAPNGTLYAFTGSSFVELFALYRSFDNGLTWNKFRDNINDTLSNFIVDHQNRIFFFKESQNREMFLLDTVTMQITQILANNKKLPYTADPTIIPFGHSFLVQYFESAMIVNEDLSMTEIKHDIGYKITSPKRSSRSGTMYAVQRGFINDAGLGVIRSTDTGRTWQSIKNHSRWGKTADIYDIAIDSNEALYVSSSIGIFRTTDDGMHWISIAIPNATIYSIQEGEEEDLLVKYVSLATSGFMRTRNDGEDWDVPPYLKYEFTDCLYIHTDSGSFLFRDNYDKGQCELFYSQQSRSGTYDLRYENPILQSALYESNDGILSGGYFYKMFRNVILKEYGLYRSSDKGFSWDKIELPFYDNSDFVYDVDAAGTLYAGYRSTIMQSADHGESWSFVNQFDLGVEFNAMRVVGANMIVGSASHGIWVSVDKGKTFSRINHPDKTIYTIVSAGGRWYIGGDRGLYSCRADGSDWRNELLVDERKKIVTLFLDKKNRLYAAAGNYGLYMKEELMDIRKSPISSADIPIRYDHLTNALMISLNSPTNITVELYDILGRKVAGFGEQDLNEGTIQLPLPQLTSGTYIATISNMHTVRTQKIIIRQ